MKGVEGEGDDEGEGDNRVRDPRGHPGKAITGSGEPKSGRRLGPGHQSSVKRSQSQNSALVRPSQQRVAQLNVCPQVEAGSSRRVSITCPRWAVEVPLPVPGFAILSPPVTASGSCFLAADNDDSI